MENSTVLARGADGEVPPVLCIECRFRSTVFFLATEQGEPLPQSHGGYCVECMPFQVGDDIPDVGKPAGIEILERWAA